MDNILDLNYFKTLLPDLAARKLNVSLFYETKSNLKKEQVRLLRDSGVLTIQPGIESFSSQGPEADEERRLRPAEHPAPEMVQGDRRRADLVLPDGIPAANRRTITSRWPSLSARVCHLPKPSGVNVVRLDRFSPNFNQSGQLGFTKLRPLPFYEFLYDLPESARHNLAYYFAYDYKVPQDVARYADPLVKSVHAWTTTWKHSELVSVDLDDRLFLLDTRPRAQAPVSVLTGADRELYLTCDAITDASALDAVERRAAAATSPAAA